MRCKPNFRPGAAPLPGGHSLLTMGRIVAVLVCSVALAACGMPSGGVVVSGDDVARDLGPAPEAIQPYVIGPGDVLGVSVYDQPQLSEADLPVRPDGRISTPLVADMQAAGRTPSELAAALTQRLGSFVKDPKVSILVHSFVGAFDQQVRVVGEAATPLAIPYRARMTVLDVMIQTRGLTRFAAGNRAVILRRPTAPGQQPIRIHVRLADLLKNGDIRQNVAMNPGDTLIIPQTWF